MWTQTLKRMISLLLLLLYLLAFTNAYLRMDLSKVSESDIQHSKRDAVNGKVSNRNSFYTAQFKVGSRRDEVEVFLHSQLNELWFPYSRCDRYSSIYDDLTRRDRIGLLECYDYGTFNPKNLTTFRLSEKYFEAFWGYQTARGYLGTDVVEFGGTSSNITFGVGYYASTIGQLGLGFEYDSTQSNFTSFGDLLVKEGVISRNAYSLQLGANNASDGVLMYGAVDHGRYHGTLQKMKMVNTSADGQFDAILINFDGILYSGGWNSSNSSVIIDIAEEWLILPSSVVLKLAELLHGYRDSTDNSYQVPCFNLELRDVIRFYFSGVELQVPVRDLVFQLYSSCLVSLIPYNEGPYIIGQDVLKSAYLVVDLEGREVAMAQANSISNGENIEEIGTDIPLASEAPLYSYSEAQDKYYAIHSRGHTITQRVSSSAENRATYSMDTSPLTLDGGGTKYVQSATEKYWPTVKTVVTTGTESTPKYITSKVKATGTYTHTTTDDLGVEAVLTSTYEYTDLTTTKTEWEKRTWTYTYLSTVSVLGAPRREDFTSESSNPGVVAKYLPSIIYLLLLALL